ncbi:MAG TPA: leucine-rich repeat protein, partial [Bacillota bacterium]|nr:leucine-rich repeat protein [Bacillota bacterium]
MNKRKRRRSPAARLGAVLLSLVMIFTLIPGVSFSVLAEEASGTPESMEAPAETPGGTPGEEASVTPGEEASVTPEAIEAPTDEASTKMLSREASVGTLGAETPASSFDYTISGGKVTITGYKDWDSSEEVIIPSTIEGYPVVAIGLDEYDPDFDPSEGPFNSAYTTAVTIPASVTSIGSLAFAYCEDLESVTFLGEAPEVGFDAFTGINDYAVFNCHIAYKANFSSRLSEYGAIKTFGELSSISIKTKPKKLEYAPGQKLELTGMTVEATYTGGLIAGNVIVTISSGFTSDPANGTPLNSLGTQTVTVTYPKTDTPQKTATFDVTVKEGEPEATPDAAFTFAEAGGSCTVSKFNGGYENVVVPKTYNGKPVTAIGDEAFSGRTALKSVVLPDSVTVIGKEAFYNCTAMDTLNLGKGVKTIGQMAFQYCKALTTVNLPASVEDIGYSAFAYCKKLTDIKVDAGSSTFKDIDGVLFSKDGKILLYYSVAGRTAKTYTVPEGTVRIEADAFRTNYEDTLTSALESVSYPSTLKEIGDRAFWQTSLKEITIYPGITMGNNVYELCKNLKTVHVAEGVTELSKNLFYGLDNLETLTLPSTLKVIGESALERYPLASIQLPEGLEEIGNDAFANAKLTSLTIPASVTTLGDRAFYINSELKTLNFAEGSKLETINQYAFSGCKALENVTLPAGLKVMGTGAFSNCYNLTAISLPDGLTALGDSVFAYTGIQTITFPDRMTTIGNYTFYGCTALNGISFPDSITTIGEGAFGGCTALTGITLPKVLEKLGAYAFEYCEHLASVEFPETIKIKTLPAGTFIDCLGLRELHLPAAITGTEDAVFLN